jgi:hypothetical protein
MTASRSRGKLALMSLRVALVTCADLPDLDADDRPLKVALESRGITVTLPRWDGPRAAFAPDACDVVVLRNPWDYCYRPEVRRGLRAGRRSDLASACRAPSRPPSSCPSA